LTTGSWLWVQRVAIKILPKYALAPASRRYTPVRRVLSRGVVTVRGVGLECVDHLPI